VSDASTHIPVLPAETLGALSPRAGEVYLDCTAGLGGHAAAVAASLGPGGTVVLCDLDAGNLARAESRVRGAFAGTVHAIHANFADAPDHLARLGLAADMVLADLGFASPQVDDPSRGLSFKRDGPLDMRLNPAAPISAADLIAETPERELADLIFEFGEDRHARRIARAIVEARRHGPITTTARLAEIVRGACPPSRGPGIDAATRTFQALRIAVNDELGSLERLLRRIASAGQELAAGRGGWLAPGARIAVISFHSLEDRPVKRCFADGVARGWAEALVRRAVTAGESETNANPRARSAKLRALRIAGGLGQSAV
jgi:16S rRNA (cytosine1402-N4)-methyltransferase